MNAQSRDVRNSLMIALAKIYMSKGVPYSNKLRTVLHKIDIKPEQFELISAKDSVFKGIQRSNDETKKYIFLCMSTVLDDLDLMKSIGFEMIGSIVEKNIALGLR